MKKLIFLCATVLAGAAAIAQPSDRFNGSLLWRVSGNGLETPSYILGTHHLNGEETFNGITGAREALESSSQVVGELLMADQAVLATQLQLAALMPEDVSYRSLLSSADYEALDNGLKELMGVGMEQFGMFKPGLISTMLSLAVFSQAYPEFNAATHIAMDVFVQNFATGKGMPVVGLETVEDQIYALFDGEPLKIQAESLACSIQHLDYSAESLKKLSAYYEAGDLAGMYTGSFDNPEDPCPLSEAAQNNLLRNRNEKWLEKLPAIMSGAPSFIAVGALHLAGEEGLLFRLDKMGYTVEAVK